MVSSDTNRCSRFPGVENVDRFEDVKAQSIAKRRSLYTDRTCRKSVSFGGETGYRRVSNDFPVSKREGDSRVTVSVPESKQVVTEMF